VHPGYSLGDATTGLMGAFGILVALRHRDQSGEGQQIDLALHEPLLRMIEWQVPLYDLLGVPQTRNGPRFPFDGAFITDICRTKDDEAFVVSAATTESLAALRRLLTSTGALTDSAASEPDVVTALRAWALTQTREAALAALHQASVVAGVINTASDLATDEHIAARQNLVAVPDGEHVVRMPNVVPHLTGSPGRVNWAGPDLGRHTDEVLRDVLTLSPERISELHDTGVVA
jgi:crotonobetainyl-CoA:carnitine CoA-transferase CaiB-like acyl-CoA transferase